MSLLQTIKSLYSNRTLLNGTLFSLFSFINRGFVFLLLLILANYITPAEYGSLNLFNTVTMVIAYFIAMSSEGYWSVSYFREGKDGLRKTFSCIVCISILVASLLLLVLLVAGKRVSVALSLPLHVLFLAIVICFTTIYINLFLDQFRLQEKVCKYGMVSCGNALLNFILSIVFVRYFMMGWYGRIYAQTLCCLLFGAMGTIYLLRQGLLTKDFTKQLKPLLLWSIPLIPHLASTFLRQGCDRYIINYSHSIDEVGLFSFALNIANIITMIGVGFNQSNSVDIYKTLGDSAISNQDKLKSITKQRNLFTTIYMGCTIIVGLLGYFLIPIVLPQYAPSKHYFAVLTIFAFFSCLYFLWTNYLFFYKKTKTIMYITFGSSILHLFLSLVLTPYSLYMTAVVYGLSQVLIVLLVRWQAIRVLKANLY